MPMLADFLVSIPPSWKSKHDKNVMPLNKRLGNFNRKGRTLPAATRTFAVDLKKDFYPKLVKYSSIYSMQSFEIKSPPWTILWFRIVGIFSVKNIARLGVFMFQTSDNSQLCIDSQYSSQ